MARIEASLHCIGSTLCIVGSRARIRSSRDHRYTVWIGTCGAFHGADPPDPREEPLECLPLLLNMPLNALMPRERGGRGGFSLRERTEELLLLSGEVADDCESNPVEMRRRKVPGEIFFGGGIAPAAGARDSRAG